MNSQQPNGEQPSEPSRSTDTGAYEPSASQAPDDRQREPEENCSVQTGAYHPGAPPPRSERYSVKHFHARGGMGEVWLAEDQAIGRTVALKRLRKERAEQRDRFLAEAQITGQLEHPSIVPVYDLGTDEDGQPFYIMPFVQGRTLQDAIAEYHAATSTVTPREMVRLGLLETFVRLCQAVAYAHSRGVVHRDLKPDNVMLGPYGETLLLDWGLAKVQGQPEQGAGSSYVHLTESSANSSQTQGGAVVGAPPYMAPEVAAGQGAEADARTDVYLLGGTLYEVLTGQPPRQGRSHSEMIELARTLPPVPPRQVKRDVPRCLEAICLKALARRKEDRYPTALALAEDVQRYLAGEAVAVYREPLRELAWRWAKRHRRGLVRSAVAALFVSAVVCGFAFVRHVEEQRRQAEREAVLLRRQDEARRQVEDFHRLADEMTFFAANTNPMAERTPYYDPRKGASIGRAAEAILEAWGPSLQELALTEKRPTVQRQVYDFLLLRAQLEEQASGDPSAGAKTALALLQRAGSLREPTRGFYRLRAAGFRLLDEEQKAAADQRRADDPATPATALDHFLLGEQYRVQSASVPDDRAELPERDAQARLLQKAIGAYREAVTQEPAFYWAHLQLGRCYLSLGERDRSLEALAICKGLRPEAPWSSSVRGLVLALSNRFPEAETELNQVLQSESDFAPARLNLGVVYWLETQYDSALEQFRAVLELPEEKRLVEAAYYRGLLYLERGDAARRDLDRALEDFARALRAKPDFRPAYLARAQAQLTRGDTKAALEDLNAYLQSGAKQIEPASAAACAQRGRLLRHLAEKLPANVRKKALVVALGELQQADKLGGHTATLFDDLGAVLELLSGPKFAMPVYSRGLELAPEDGKLRNKRGWANVALKQYDKARDDFTVPARLEPRNATEQLTRAEAHTGLGYLLALDRSTVAAQQEATRALLQLKGVDHYVVRHNLACIYGELSRSKDAGRTAHEALAVDFLREAVALARRTGATAEELRNIHNELAFPKTLQDRPEFQQLLQGNER